MSGERRLHLDGRGVLLVLGCTVVWGMGQVASKIALAQIPPLTQAGLRSVGAGMLVLVWVRVRRIPLWDKDGTWWPGLLAGSLFAGEFACVYLGLRDTTAGRMTVFLYVAPFVVAGGMVLVARAERLGAVALAGMTLAFAGVVLAFADGFTAAAVGPYQWRGDLLGLAAALGWGATTIVIRASRLGPAPPAKTLLYQLAVSGVLLPVVGLLTGERVAWPLTGEVAGALLFQIAVVSSTSYLVWFWLVATYAAARLSAFTLLTPVVALAAGAALLAEPLTARLLVAVGCVGAGLLLVNRRGPADRGQQPAPTVRHVASGSTGSGHRESGHRESGHRESGGPARAAPRGDVAR